MSGGSQNLAHPRSTETLMPALWDFVPAAWIDEAYWPREIGSFQEKTGASGPSLTKARPLFSLMLSAPGPAVDHFGLKAYIFYADRFYSAEAPADASGTTLLIKLSC